MLSKTEIQNFSAFEQAYCFAFHLAILLGLLINLQPWFALPAFALFLKAKEIFMLQVFGLETIGSLDY